MRTVVDHADHGEEEGCHQTMRYHLHHGPGHGGFGKHTDTQQHEATMAYRRVGVDILQVFLHHGGEGAVYDRDHRKGDHHIGVVLRSLW